jgi:hypothetical protein
MRVNFSHILLCGFVAVLGLLTSTNVSAQSENDPSTDELNDLNQAEQLNLNDDKTLIFEHESRSSKVKDSSHVHVATPIAPTKVKSSEQAKPSAAKEEDDVLSFNFLYYIIEKFKISDLIDE